MDKQEDGMYENYYGKNHRYALRTENNGVNDIVTGTDKGLVQLTMDEELMHGATIRITYLVKVKNVGETDYVDDATKDFYYKGCLLYTSDILTVTNGNIRDIDIGLYTSEKFDLRLDKYDVSYTHM